MVLIWRHIVQEYLFDHIWFTLVGLVRLSTSDKLSSLDSVEEYQYLKCGRCLYC